MKNNDIGKTTNLIFLVIFLLLNAVNVASAQLRDTTAIEAQDEAFVATANFDESFDLGAAVATIVKAFLGLLGIIFIFLMILAGYHWMTAAGDEQKITKAKDTLRAAVIGLIIIVAAYSITYFVFKALGNTITSTEVAAP